MNENCMTCIRIPVKLIGGPDWLCERNSRPGGWGVLREPRRELWRAHHQAGARDHPSQWTPAQARRAGHRVLPAREALAGRCSLFKSPSLNQFAAHSSYYLVHFSNILCFYTRTFMIPHSRISLITLTLLPFIRCYTTLPFISNQNLKLIKCWLEFCNLGDLTTSPS